MGQYIWQSETWPEFSWDSAELLRPLGQARQAQGRLLGEVRFGLGLEMQAELLTQEGMSTAAIEGDHLNRQAVRSSVARRLGLPTAGLPTADRRVEGLVEMLLDATTGFKEPLTAGRLCGWNAALFPTGYSGLVAITVGRWRDSDEPMQVVSGPIGHERVHYQAPPSQQVPTEMDRFLAWWSAPPAGLDGMVRAGLAHLWFVSIHPFEDGNGRIARAITDMALSQDEGRDQRLYSMSQQIQVERNAYYDVLERTQKGTSDATEWVVWFLECLARAIERSESQVALALSHSRFWQQHAEAGLSQRQVKVVKRLLEAGPDGFEGGMTNRKYVGLAKVSRETAKRDLADLVDRGILRKNQGGGRSVSYSLIWPDQRREVQE